MAEIEDGHTTTPLLSLVSLHPSLSVTLLHPALTRLPFLHRIDVGALRRCLVSEEGVELAIAAWDPLDAHNSPSQLPQAPHPSSTLSNVSRGP